MKILKFSLLLITTMLALTLAAPTPEDTDTTSLDPIPLNQTFTSLNSTDNALGALGYDPSYYYHDYSTAQIWIGRTQQTVGWVVDADLYRKIWGELDRGCPDNSNDHWGGQDRGLCRNPGGLGFATKCLINPPFGHGDCYTRIHDVWGEWENDQIRKLLIGAIAGTLEALTVNQSIIGKSNCFQLGGQKACNVGDIVRVNLPPSGKNVFNHMHIRIQNSHSWFSDFYCCRTRQPVDKAIDGLGDEMTTVFPSWWNRKFTRDTRCIIDGWKSCEEIGGDGEIEAEAEGEALGDEK